MAYPFAEISPHTHRFDCLKNPMIFELESIQFSLFHVFALVWFILAIIHTLSINKIHRWARYIEIKQAPKRRGHRWERSISVQLLYFLAEVELIFALWVIPLFFTIAFFYGWTTALEYINTRDYTEPLFVAVVLSLAATRPILMAAENAIRWCANCLGGSLSAWWLTLLILGPLLGSFITEVAAMTLCALLLSHQFYIFKPSLRLSYATIALLFVNVSVGGILTEFASPAVLILAHAWNWTSADMFIQFGWKATMGITIATSLYWFLFRKEFRHLDEKKRRLIASEFLHKVKEPETPIPKWITVIHMGFITAIVAASHYPAIFLAIFFFFVGFHQATRGHQYPIRLVRPMLIGLFLAGLVIHGGVQGWWVINILNGLSPMGVLGAAIVMTGFNDNAAISYLTALIPDWGAAYKYAVFTGVVAGGGLTVIANAPNPAGYTILERHFEGGIRPWYLFLGALIPTIILYLIFFFLGPLI